MNTKRYWLRGLLTGFIVGLILYFTYVIAMTIISTQILPEFGILVGFAVLVQVWPIMIIVSVIGLLVGWIYGKIKNQHAIINP